jgi:hypothetical protein
MREGLRTIFNVLIDIRLMEWSVGGFSEEHYLQWEIALSFAEQGYVKSKSSMDLDNTEIEEYVQHHVNASPSAKKDKKFDADRICLHLAHRYDIAINIKLKH